MSGGVLPRVQARVVEIGSRVRVHGDDEEREFVIVDPAEADGGGGRVSSDSPLARAVLARVLGEVARVQAPGGEHLVRIVAIIAPGSEDRR